MNTLKWTPRIIVGTGMVLASLFAVPAVAGADPTCYTGCTPPNVSPTSVPVPSDGGSGVAAVHTTTSTMADGSSSLPFTGVDVAELAAVGAGAVVIGGVLTRRRRRTA